MSQQKIFAQREKNSKYRIKLFEFWHSTESQLLQLTKMVIILCFYPDTSFERFTTFSKMGQAARLSTRFGTKYGTHLGEMWVPYFVTDPVYHGSSYVTTPTNQTTSNQTVVDYEYFSLFALMGSLIGYPSIRGIPQNGPKLLRQR